MCGIGLIRGVHAFGTLEARCAVKPAPEGTSVSGGRAETTIAL